MVHVISAVRFKYNMSFMPPVETCTRRCGLWTVDCRPCGTFSDFFGVLSFAPFYDFVNTLTFTCLMLDMKSSFTINYACFCCSKSFVPMI